MKGAQKITGNLFALGFRHDHAGRGGILGKQFGRVEDLGDARRVLAELAEGELHFG